MRKPKQKVEQKLEIPNVLINQLKGFCKRAEELSVADYLLMVLDETDATKQTADLKKAIDNLKKLLSSDGNDEITTTCFQVLTYIFMDCDCKNPCRRTIASFFQAINDSLWPQLQTYISTALLQTLEDTMGKIDKSDKDVNFRKPVDTICSLLENFSMGEECISANVITVLEFLATSIECQLKRESLVGTPALQTVAMLDCLVTIKAIMSVIQKCTEGQHKTLQDHKYIALNKRFLKVIFTILKNDAFFPDCRSAAGMAFPRLVRTITTEKTLIPVILSLFFSSYICQQFPQHTTISSHWVFTTVDSKTIKGMSGFSYLSICRGVMAMVSRDTLVAKQKTKGLYCKTASPSNSTLKNYGDGMLMTTLNKFIQSDHANDGNGSILLDVLFPEIISLCAKLKDSNSVVAFRTLANWTSQTREAICTASVDDIFKSRLIGSSTIAQTLLNIVWNYWDHPLEAMRYHTREIFDNVVKTHVTLTATGDEPICDAFMEELTNKLCKMDWFIRGKYGPLCCLVDILGAHAILKVHPSVPQDLMMVMCDQSIVPHAMEFAEKMFRSHLEKLSRETEQYLDKWFKIWVLPGLQCLSSGAKSSRKHVTEYYIPKLLKCCPQSLHLMIHELQEPTTLSEGNHNVDDVGGLVTCLKTARHLGLLPRAELLNEDNDLWQDTIPVIVLEQSLCHLDDEIRCDVLGLICDSVRTTEPLTVKDLELLKNFYPANMNSQSPSFRQRALGITKKLFIRLRDGGRSLKKKISGRKCDVELTTMQLDPYVEFLQWFGHLQFQSLFPGSSFARRTTALQNLTLLLHIFPMNAKNEDPFAVFECSEVFSAGGVHILLDCLKDTYDVNKKMAFDLLVACSSSVQPFMEPLFASEWVKTATQSAVSPKAINVSTAAYMFKLLIRKSPHEITLPSNEESGTKRSKESGTEGSKGSGTEGSEKSGTEQCKEPRDVSQTCPQEIKLNEEIQNNDEMRCLFSAMSLTRVAGHTKLPCKPNYHVISQLVQILQSQVDVARKNLLHAAFEAPIHGVLYCLREIICDFELSEIAGNKQWQSLVMSIIQGCYDVTDVVSPVVTNASPEGNLTVNDSFLNNEDDVDSYEGFAPKAQILLVCCWRAMKEVSLLLGEISKRAPVKEKDSEYGLLSFSEFETIGQLFTNILLTSKHRGAYELAHEGFLKLCHMLWRCKQRDLQCLPEQLLSRLLSDMCSDTPTPWLCGTRRSAGLPFFFKAIITTEPSSTGKCCFNSVMRELLNTAAKSVAPLHPNKDTTLPQVHARNILRALYKETKLGEDVYPYVAEGVQVAVEGFLSDSWAVRNSSTLLFSALMNRIFGPQKFQEEKRRQGMTGREFFSRFPTLHSFLIKQLEISLNAVESDSNTSTHLYPSLYPVLLLLSRLHPSAMDGKDSTLNMAAFIPYVLRCSKSYVLKTRAMAARALVPLVTGEALPDMFQELVKTLPENNKQRVCQNHVHGSLLQIRDLLTSVSSSTSLSVRTKQTISAKLTPLLLQHTWLATNLNPCDTTRAVFLVIIRMFVIDRAWVSGETYQPCFLDPTSQSVIDNVIQQVVQDTLQPLGTGCYVFPIGRTFVNEEIARIALHPISVKSRNGVLDTTDVSHILRFLSTSDYEVTLVALGIVYEIFANLKDHSSCEEQLDVIVNKLLEQVVHPTMKPSCLNQVYKCLSLLPRSLKFPWSIADREPMELIEGWRHVLFAFQNNVQRSEIKCSLVQFSSSLLVQLHEKLSSENRAADAIHVLEEWVSYVEACASDEESEVLRLTVSQILGSDSVSCILTAPYHIYEYLPFRLWKLIVLLLLDDSVDVKVSMAAGLTNVFQGAHQDTPKHCSMHSALAVRHVVRKPLELYWTESSTSCVAWLLSLLTDTPSSDYNDGEEAAGDTAYDDMATMDRLFEKGPLNTYSEDCVLAEAVFTTFVSWVTCGLGDLPKGWSELLSHLHIYVKGQIEKCDESLPQHLLYCNLYKTLAGLAMLDVLLKKCGKDEDEDLTKNRELLNNMVITLKEIRSRDCGHCFHHLKLQELSELVLGK